MLQTRSIPMYAMIEIMKYRSLPSRSAPIIFRYNICIRAPLLAYPPRLALETDSLGLSVTGVRTLLLALALAVTIFSVITRLAFPVSSLIFVAQP